VVERSLCGGRTNAHLRLHALELFCIHVESTVAPQLHSCVEPIQKLRTTSVLLETKRMSGRGNFWLAGQGAEMDLWEVCGSYVGAEGSVERAREESDGDELFCPRLMVGK
jgi:hypothetical protein